MQKYLSISLLLLQLLELLVLLGHFTNIRVLQVLNFDLDPVQNVLQFSGPLRLTGGSRLMLLHFLSGNEQTYILECRFCTCLSVVLWNKQELVCAVRRSHIPPLILHYITLQQVVGTTDACIIEHVLDRSSVSRSIPGGMTSAEQLKYSRTI